MRRSTKFILTSTVIFAHSFYLPAFCAAGSDYQTKAINAYNESNFSSAVRYFQLAVVDQPANQTLRYYLANSLAHCGQFPKALIQYRAAYAINGKTPIAAYCQPAMAAYGGLSPAPIKNAMQKQIDQMPALNQTRALLTQQGNEVASATYDHDMRSAQDLTALGRNQAQTIQDNANRTIEAIRESHSGHQDCRIEIVQERAANDQSNAIEAAAYAAADQRRTALEQSEAIQSATSGLVSQLNPNAKGITLSPAGTNLYVRNYLYNPP